LLTFAALAWLVFGETSGLFISQPIGRPSAVDFLILAAILSIAVLAIDLLVTNMRQSLERAQFEISQRKQAEEAVKNSEKRFHALIKHGRDNISLLMADGTLLWESPSAVNTLGYAPNQFAGHNIFELIHPDDQAWTGSMYAQVLQYPGNIQEGELRLLHADGSWRWIECSATNLLDEPSVQAIVLNYRDITARKQTEHLISARLELMQYSESHSLADVLQKTLDQVGELSSSPIGFYHFVESDQQTLSLQAWSTRTLQEFCQAQGGGLHYPIDQAGVWADCARNKQALIHNDYASLPQRHGMPDGHAQVVRELVVPILRGEKVVAILGVGNKPSDYMDRDIELVTYFADVAWEITARKQAEEQLRHQGTHDALTGIYNRTFFEVELARLEHSRDFPISIVVADVDKLKVVNDTRGHAVGDQFLRQVANLLSSVFREGDILARIGGDEFAVLLPATQTTTAEKMLRRVRDRVAQQNSEHPDLPVQLSLGMATAEKSSLIAAFTLADQRMYADKAERAAVGRTRKL
jgi:diguanylate cyclase (GGDEF)-like protein/PAS domain S-box-containing protein